MIGDWLPIGAEDVRDPLKIINDSRPSAQRSKMAAAEAKLKDYRKLVEEAQEEFASLARVNYRLDIRNHEMETQLQARDAAYCGLSETDAKQLQPCRNLSPYPMPKVGRWYEFTKAA